MHAGTRIVQLNRRRGGSGSGSGNDDDDDEWEFAVLAKFEEHKSMNYGSDVQPLIGGGGGVSGAKGEEGREERVIVSTSFYDRLMCVWRV